MPSTPEYGYPYPAPSDTPDVPYWLQQLAEAVEEVTKHPMCKIQQGAAQSLGTTSSPVLVDFNGGSTVYDTDTMADIANDAVVIKKAGFYRLSASLNWTANATGYRAILIRKNGSAYIVQSYTQAANGAVTVATLHSEPIELAVNDSLTLYSVQSSGSSLSTSSANGIYPFLAAEWIGL